jgi:sporulation protein YtfJ
MAEHPIQGLMNITMDKIREMADSNTIIGKPITTEDGTMILPVSRVSFGFATGGSDFNGKNNANKDLFGGGTGAGVSIAPVAFLVVKDGAVRTIQLTDGSNSIDRALTMLPELVDKVSAMIKNKGEGKENNPQADAAAPNE